MKRALLVFAHGAREPAWSIPLDALADEGIYDVAVLPVFWAAQGHVTRELPQLIAPARARRQRVRLLPTLSQLPGMLDYVARAATESLRAAQSL